MLFEASITIPKNTLKAAPAEVIFPIGMGVINKMMVRPRHGHASLAHCVILLHEHQIFPSIEDMEFHGDTHPIDWEDQLTIDQPPYELKILGWNEDDTYKHTFDIYVAMLEQAVAEKQGTIGGMLAKFLKMVGITS